MTKFLGKTISLQAVNLQKGKTQLLTPLQGVAEAGIFVVALDNTENTYYLDLNVEQSVRYLGAT